jgi:hypothetical protein
VSVIRCAAIMLSLVLTTGCGSRAATGPSTGGPAPPGLAPLVGLWEGWLTGPRTHDWVSLEIKPDASFVLVVPRVRSQGTITLGSQGARYEGTGGWLGSLALEGEGDTQVLKFARDDKQFAGELTRYSAPGLGTPPGRPGRN